MTVTRILHAALCITAGVLLSTLAVACGADETAKPPASPSASTSISPAAVFSGKYTVTYDDGSITRWTVTPCGEGCADILSEVEIENAGGTPQKPATRRALLEGDTWTMKYFSENGFVCDDGTTETDMDAIQTWNATTLKGTFDAKLHGPGCGKPDGAATGPAESFTLVKSK